jgi:hypothetical protein
MRRGTRRVACVACVLSLVSISGCRGAGDKPDGGAKEEAFGARDSGTCDATVESVSCVPSCAAMVCGAAECADQLLPRVRVAMLGLVSRTA